MSKTKVGVLGNGFVGEAISFAFSSSGLRKQVKKAENKE